MVPIMFNLWKFFAAIYAKISGLFNSSKAINPDIVQAIPKSILADRKAAEAYHGKPKKEDRPYNKTGISYYYGQGKGREQINKKHKNRVRTKIQRHSRKVNLMAA